MVRGFGESRDLLLSPSRSDLVVQSCYFFPCSKSRDLGPEHGFRACSFKNKGKKLDFHENVGFWRVKKPKKTKTWNEIGQMLVSGALDDTKTIGKVGADIFAKSGPGTPQKNLNKSKNSPGFSSFFPWT